MSLHKGSLTITKEHARRFLLEYHNLLTPRSLAGKNSIMDYISRVGCIQYDPINVVGRNPDLVLQARINNYNPALLDALLYEDRKLWDGWDKVSSIYLIEDWPYFARHRAHMMERYWDPSSKPVQLADQVLQALEEQGPMSSIDFKKSETLKWSWGQTTSLERASLEVLYVVGRIGIHHRVNTRRYFELVSRLIDGKILATPDPNFSDEDYQNWHIQRRLGGIGIASPRATDYWLGILGVKTPQRKATFERLEQAEKIVSVCIEGLPDQTFNIRADDIEKLESAAVLDNFSRQAAFIAPLDNIIWDRSLLRWLFNFDYVWEVYKPVKERKYGYYVLPVLYGDQFIARFDPEFDKKSKYLNVKNWWWEEDAPLDDSVFSSLQICMQAFCDYLGVARLEGGELLRGKKDLDWLFELTK